MNEQYIAPELQVVCFAPVEKLAGELDADLLLDISGGNGPSAGFKDGDFGIDIM